MVYGHKYTREYKLLSFCIVRWISDIACYCNNFLFFVSALFTFKFLFILGVTYTFLLKHTIIYTVCAIDTNSARTADACDSLTPISCSKFMACRCIVSSRRRGDRKKGTGITSRLLKDANFALLRDSVACILVFRNFHWGKRISLTHEQLSKFHFVRKDKYTKDSINAKRLAQNICL